MNAPADPAVVHILLANHERFLAFLERRLGDRSLAEDLLQSAYVRGIERGGELREGERAVAWFYRLLRNAITDHHRRRAAEGRRHERLAVEAAREGQDPELEGVVCACVGELVGLLRPEYAHAVRRADLEGASLAEVAAEAGITANNAGVRLHRARKALRRELERSCGTCTEHGCLDCSCGEG